MPPAARITDMHTCPQQTPAFPSPIPHVGGPILPPGYPTVLIGNLPAACVGDMALCVGPPDTIAQGSATVLIGGKPAARMGDTTAHGGQIVFGCPHLAFPGTSLRVEPVFPPHDQNAALWQQLGSPLLSSILYKVRMLRFQPEKAQKGAPGVGVLSNLLWWKKNR